MKRALQFLIIGAIVGPLGARAGPDIWVTVFVTVARQDCPLQIKGFKLPEKVGDPARVLVHNASQKQIREFALETLIGSREPSSGKEARKIGWISSTSEPASSLKWALERNLPPDGYGETHDSILASHNLVSRGRQLRSNCLHVAVIVRHIEYQDGTTWHFESGREQETWENSLGTGNSASCDKPSGAQEAMDRLEPGAGYNKSFGALTHANQEPLQSYTVSCPVQNIEQKLRPMCPM